VSEALASCGDYDHHKDGKGKSSPVEAQTWTRVLHLHEAILMIIVSAEDRCSPIISFWLVKQPSRYDPSWSVHGPRILYVLKMNAENERKRRREGRENSEG
jgi:hypothetical protein